MARASIALSHAQENRIRTELVPIRVASIPAAHPYVRAITDPQRVQVLPDPPVPGAPAGQWWPPVALTAEWLVSHAEDYDLLHVHFGLESFSPEELMGALDAAQRLGRPIVYTVHDLENPQLVDQEPYRALLDVIVPAADRLLTLTAGASAEIERRWGREIQALPHPTLLEHDVAAGHRDDEAIRIGIHLRDLRPNIDAEHAVHAAVGAAALLVEAGIRVQFDVLMNERVRDEETATRVVAAAEAHPAVHVRRTPHLTDAEIEEWLGGIDLFVLPYLHGTHSGWVELCYDLGVHVAGTDVGHIGEQHPEDFAIVDLDDVQTLTDAVRLTAGSRNPSERAALVEGRRAVRLAERAAVQAAHADVYAAVCAAVRAEVRA